MSPLIGRRRVRICARVNCASSRTAITSAS
jgi:hypothetical protein